MAHAIATPRVTRKGYSPTALVGAIAKMLASENTLALRAAHTAALHRRKTAELRAMYVSTA